MLLIGRILRSVRRAFLYIPPSFSQKSAYTWKLSVAVWLSGCALIFISDRISRHVLSWDWFFMSRSWLSLDTCMSCLGSVSSFHVSSCLMSHDCVLTVSLSGIAKCLFCAETLTFLAETFLTASQFRLNLILNVVARLVLSYRIVSALCPHLYM